MIDYKTINQSQEIIIQEKEKIFSILSNDTFIVYQDVLAIGQYTKEEYKNILMKFYNEMRRSLGEYGL